jgi:hypothetical protein
MQSRKGGRLGGWAFQKTALLELSDELQVDYGCRGEIAELRIALGEFVGNEIGTFGRRHGNLEV